ncbi:hypothetical protein ACRQ5D_16540 [Mucilaginibacter sp. P25]
MMKKIACTALLSTLAFTWLGASAQQKGDAAKPRKISPDLFGIFLRI